MSLKLNKNEEHEACLQTKRMENMGSVCRRMENMGWNFWKSWVGMYVHTYLEHASSALTHGFQRISPSDKHLCIHLQVDGERN